MMQLLAPPRVIPGRTIDFLDTAPDHGISQGLARVDLNDPELFDHPLDHVSGMLLAAASLELAEHASMLKSDNVAFRLTFARFCELDAPVELTAGREVGETSRIDITQSGRTVAHGLLTERATRLGTGRAAVPALGVGSISGELVHRTHPNNIAIAPLAVNDGRVWTRVRKQCAIGGLPPRAGAVASILEAARQFAIAILHRWGEQPLGVKMIFVGLTAEVPTAIPPGHLALALSWQVAPPEQTRKLLIELHEVGERASKVGSILMVIRCVDADEYARLRAA
jgi:hypothetical protein